MIKEGWERMEQPTSLDMNHINQLIQQAFPSKHVISAERIGIGLSNSNYKIALEGSIEPYVLRLFRGGSDIAEKELALAQLVRQTVPVAEFLYLDTSQNTIEKSWAMLEWKEGILLRDVLKKGSPEEIAMAASSVGRTLSNIHNYKFPESGFFGKELQVTERFEMEGERLLAFMEECLFHTQCGTWLGEELTQEVWTFSQKYSSLLSESNETPVLVHSDFNGLNILMQRGTTGYSVSAVLDWEDAFSWSRYADFGNLLRYETNGSLFEKHFIQAYQEKGAVLEENWKLLSKLEDLVALCEMLSRSTLDTPNRMRDLKNLISKTVKPF